jgi:hypothetical protein
MADTIIPPPDPNATPKPTFEPAPVPVPNPAATSPAPAASPSANGLAAPGAQPATPAAAPGATPNPTTAGTTPNAAAKEAVSALAQPTPLPLTPAQEAAKAAAAGAGAGAAASSAAAGQAGQAQQKAQADAQAAASKKAAAPPAAPKTTAQTALDTLSPVNDTIKKMLEGKDPIAAVQFNQILNNSGPKNQATLSALGMKLAQQNMDGQGAGSALLEMLARDQDYDVGQLQAQVASDSAKRLADMNTWGFQKALDIQQAQDKQVRDDLSTALANGQLDTAAGLWSKVYPGVPFDSGAAKAASPQQTASFNSRMKLVDQYVAQGDATNAKAIMDQLAGSMPEMFGFPNDPEAAKKAVSGIDYTSEAWANNIKFQSDATTAARTAALQGDMAGLSSSIDQIFSKMTPAAVESIATSAANTRPLDEINKILAASGMAPVASTDEAKMLDKTQFAKAVKSYDLMANSKKDVVDGLLDTFAKADPAIAIDPAARNAAKAWLAMHAYGIATNPDTGAVTNFTLDDKSTPPWDASSPQAYMFMDWPVATFNADGSVAQRSYNGMTPYSQDYKPGDLTSPKGKEDSRLDKAYEQYVFSVPADERLPMESWYYATSGGTKDVNKDSLTGSLKPDNTPDPQKVAALQQKVVSGGQLTDDDIKLAIASKAIPSYTASSVGGLTGDAGKQFMTAHPDGTFLVNNKQAKLIDSVHVSGGVSGGVDYAKVQDPKSGKIYFMLPDGSFVDVAPKPLYTDKNQIPKPIPNPFA